MPQQPDPPPAGGWRHLTKRDFLAGLQCHKQLWWRVHEPSALELVPDGPTRTRMETGRQVGVCAREYLPGGRLISFRHQATAARIAATASAMAAGAPALYEATFASDGLIVHADILERANDGWTLIEVTSSLDVKERQVADAAIQAQVLRRSGVDVRRIEIMHLNRACRHPDLSNLFIREDVTGQVGLMHREFAAQVEAQLLMLQNPLPERTPSDHCSNPSRCPFWDRCWPPLPEHHVSTLYRSGGKVTCWEQQGWQTVFELPEDIQLNPIARRQVAAVRAGRIHIEATLAAALESFVAPLAFLDFETVAPAIPRWPGCAPYTPVPVQVSCHFEDASGICHHSEWLADGPEDPRPEVARYLVEACGGARTIVAYNAGYEAECIRHLAGAVPQLEAELLSLELRLTDLLPVIREQVYHPAFGGSFSLKQVLPALVPGRQYHGRIAEGKTARDELMEMLFGGRMDPQERSIIRESLLAYCKQDTWAMVQLLRRLRDLAGR
jgi:hypothetical protein